MFIIHNLYELFYNVFIIFLQIVGFVLILSPVYSKITDLFTSWPIVGGTIACGVFIMVIASAGIYGAVKHHQIVLFFVSFKLVLEILVPNKSGVSLRAGHWAN